MATATRTSPPQGQVPAREVREAIIGIEPQLANCGRKIISPGT
jgi:hypothetical protein